MVIHFHSEKHHINFKHLRILLADSHELFGLTRPPVHCIHHAMTDAGYPGRMPCGKWLHWLLGLWDILPSRPGCWGFCSQRIISPQKYGDFMGFQQQNWGFDHEKWPFQQPPKLCRWPPCRPSKNHGPTWSGRCDLGRLVASGRIWGISWWSLKMLGASQCR